MSNENDDNIELSQDGNRDQYGRFVKGNNVSRLTAEQLRKGGSVTKADRIGRLFAMFEAKPLTATEAVQLDQWLLTRTKEELAKLLKDDQQPVVVQARAQQLLERKLTFEATERMYDRAFGKPTQRQEIATNEVPPIVVQYVDGSKEQENNQ